MKKKIILFSLLSAFIMLAIPAVSAVESESAEERLELKETLLEELKDIIQSKNHEPGCILRMLLIIRNLLLICGGLIIIVIVTLLGKRTAV
jgi:hypothetical protein